MKIALIGPVLPYRGGISQYTQLLRTVLESVNHQILMVSFHRQYPAFLYPGKSDKDPSHIEPLPDVLYLLDPLKPWTWLNASKEIDAFRPDLIVFQWWTTFWALPFYSTIRLLQVDCPIIFIIHNVYPHEKKFYDPFLTHLAFSTSDAFIVHTEREKQRLQSVVHTEHVAVCPLPVFDRFSDEQISRQDARSRLNIPLSRFVLLFFGIIRPYKGLKTLLSALSILRDHGHQPLLFVCGEFWEDFETYNRLIRDLNLTDQVCIDNRFIPDDEANLYFSAADALITPYTGGTQSAAATYGLVYNIPIIASDHVTNGIPIQYHEQVHSFQAGDVNSLALAIEALMNHQQTNEPSKTDGFDHQWKCLVTALERSACN